MLWGAAAAGGALAAVRLGWLYSRWIRPELVNAIVGRTCLAGEWSRALKLCRAGAESPYCLALSDVLVSLVGPDGKNRPHQPIFGLAEPFDEAFSRRVKRLAETQWLIWLAALLLLGPALRWSQTLRTMPHSGACTALFALGALLAVGSELLAGYMRRASVAAGAALVPQLTEALTLWSGKDPPIPAPAPPALPTGPEPKSESARLDLQIYRGDTLLEERPFFNKVLKIGNLPSSHIGAGEASLSRMHALIELGDDGTAQIIDLGTESGTLVNGRKANKASLRAGDELRVGELRLRIKQVSAAKH